MGNPKQTVLVELKLKVVEKVELNLKSKLKQIKVVQFEKSWTDDSRCCVAAPAMTYNRISAEHNDFNRTVTN